MFSFDTVSSGPIESGWNIVMADGLQAGCMHFTSLTSVLSFRPLVQTLEGFSYCTYAWPAFLFLKSRTRNFFLAELRGRERKRRGEGSQTQRDRQADRHTLCKTLAIITHRQGKAKQICKSCILQDRAWQSGVDASIHGFSSSSYF